MEHFSSDGNSQAAALKNQMPSFIKPAPTTSASGATATSPPAPPSKKTGIALDSLEPVIVSGVSSSAITSTATPGTSQGINPNNPSPQNFASSAKGMDLLQGGDIL